MLKRDENTQILHSDLLGAKVKLVRATIRQGLYTGHTAGLCSDKVQCNLVIIKRGYAEAFQAFCQSNPIPCPIVGISAVGDPKLTMLGKSIDIRTDVPRYRVYKYGKLIEERTSIAELWQNDFVSIAIGCSFSFESALMKSGIPMRHIDENVTVPMYKTNIATQPAGPFNGPTVVSMRPIKSTDLELVKDVCKSYPFAHGGPLHVGTPSKIGIADVANPDWGDAVPIRDGEVPAFWACGVTSQVAITNACPEICITHAPGAMLITDQNEISIKK